MEVVIVTGASRGLGAALVGALLARERRVIGVARHANAGLEDRARDEAAWLDWYLQDLSDSAACEVLARSICDEMPHDASRYVLINNAATLAPLSRVEGLTAAALDTLFGVNLSAAMLFTAHFARATEALAADKRVLNISSGAGRNPLEGGSAYCSSKAALDMFTRVLALEQAGRAHPLRAVSLSPGVIDTGMQADIRAAEVSELPQRQRFVDLKAKGELAAPDATAQRIIAYLGRSDFGAHDVDTLLNY